MLVQLPDQGFQINCCHLNHRRSGDLRTEMPVQACIGQSLEIMVSIRCCPAEFRATASLLRSHRSLRSGPWRPSMDDAGLANGLAGLAAPLPGDAPAGADLRQDFTPQSLYYRLRDARAEAREIERRVDHDPSADAGVPIQWRTVRDLAIKALGEQTKDLEIAAWLTEALVRLEGMSGLAAGSSVIAGLAAALWDNGLHPQPDEEGIETQVAPITGLSGQGTDGTLMQPLRKCVLFPGPDGEPVSYWQYLQSEELETITDAARRKQRLAAKVVPLADMASAARQAGGARLSALRSEVQGALKAWTHMSEVVEAKAGAAAPPTSRVRDLLRAIAS